MNAGDKIVLAENTIVVDDLGTDYLLKGTMGVVKADNGDMLTVETAKGTYEIPATSIKTISEDIAA